jgi:hypothetical protein
MIRILINGFEAVNQPIGIDELKESFSFSQELFGFTREIVGSLTFYGDDFTFFWDLFRMGVCTDVVVDIQEREGDNGDWVGIWYGLIYINDIEFNADTRNAKAEIIDNSFVAKIINYLDTPISLFTERTRGGEPISITPQSILVVDHNNVTQSGIVAYTLVDLLEYFTRFITDNNVTVQSTYLSSAPFDEYYFVRGTDLRQLSGINTLLVTFGDLLRDVCKLFNTRWVIETNQIGNVLRIENVEYFENSSLIEVEGFKEFNITSNEELDYTSFAFGSHKSITTNFDNSDTWVLRSLIPPFSGYAESSISPDGGCQAKTEYSLVTRIVCYDSNTISKVRNTTTDAEFDDVLFIVTDAGSVWYNIEERPINNFELLCANQLKRWLKSYCFDYPTQIQTCDSFRETEDEVVLAFSDILFLKNVLTGCYTYQSGSLLEPTATVSIELNITFYADPLENPPGVSTGTVRLFFENVANPFESFIAPFTGWTNFGTIAGTNPPLVQAVDRSFVIGETFTYQCLIHNITLEAFFDLSANIIAPGDIENLTVVDGSYIKIRNNSYQAFDSSQCRFNRFKVAADGYLTYNKAKEIRESRFGNILLPNNFANFTGNISELSRNLLTSETNITINTKTI